MRTLLACLLVPAAVACAQYNPISGFNKVAYGQLRLWVLRSAEKMPQEAYSFRPTDAVRSFGQIVGHVADTQYFFCSAAQGEPNPAPKIEQTKTGKADLIAALKGAYAYCDKVYESATDASASQTVKLMGADIPKPGVLNANVIHMAEHYGNLVTYMRLKNIVPPSSEAPPSSKK
jgi:uncharacterized damage-inducible protein DinB